MSQTFDILVDHRFFLDVRVRHGHVSLWLIEVVVGDKVVDCRVRKKFAIFGSKLCRQRLVVCDNERRFLEMLDHICHSKCLS